MDAVVPKGAPKRRKKPRQDEELTEEKQQPEEKPDEIMSENDGEITHVSSEYYDENSGNDTVSECENAPYSIESRTHSRSGATIFAVLFSKEIEAAGERNFVQTARDFNGYWSYFGNGGYIFNSQQDAEDFAKTIAGKEETNQKSHQQQVLKNGDLTATYTEGKPPVIQDEHTLFDGNTSCT